jgi:hypothetical protein
MWRRADETNQRFGVKYYLDFKNRRTSYSLLASCFLQFSCLAYYLTLNLEICSSETSDFLRTTQRYNPEDCILHIYRCENLKSKVAATVNHFNTLIYYYHHHYYDECNCYSY